MRLADAEAFAPTVTLAGSGSASNLPLAARQVLAGRLWRRLTEAYTVEAVATQVDSLLLTSGAPVFRAIDVAQGHSARG
jgi:hypothetical protein